VNNEYFSGVSEIVFEGPETTNDLAFRYYDRDRLVLGKRMEDHLRFAVCYWHSFCWPGGDVFGERTFDRPWLDSGHDALTRAEQKTDVAFEFFSKLGVPFFCFHDRDVAPEGDGVRESCANFDRIAERIEVRMSQTDLKLLWARPTYSATHAMQRVPQPIQTPRSSLARLRR